MKIIKRDTQHMAEQNRINNQIIKKIKPTKVIMEPKEEPV